MNEIATTERSTMRSVAIASGANGASLAPESLADVVRFAEVMCKADIALPKHLRGNAGACMAVALQALEWQMSPFAVASKSYAVNGAIAYEAQLIAAVVNTRSGIKGRLKYTFEGSGPSLVCTVSGMLDGEECSYTSPPAGSIPTKNSPLWKSDPQQQLGYYSARSWARRHCPEVILGVYDRDEMQAIGPENARDVTPAQPSLMQRLQSAPTAVTDQREGFNADFIDRETSPSTEIEEEATDTSIDDAEDEISDVSQLDPAADVSEPGLPLDTVQQDALAPGDLDWLKLVARMLWAATEVGKQDILTSTYKAVRENHFPDGLSQKAIALGKQIKNYCFDVADGERDAGEALTLIANAAGCEPREVTA